MLGLSRDTLRLPPSLFPFVLRKAYFDCPERLLLSGMVGALHLIEGGEGSGVCSRCSKEAQLLLYNADSPFVILAGIAVVEKMYSVPID